MFLLWQWTALFWGWRKRRYIPDKPRNHIVRGVAAQKVRCWTMTWVLLLLLLFLFIFKKIIDHPTLMASGQHTKLEINIKTTKNILLILTLRMQGIEWIGSWFQKENKSKFIQVRALVSFFVYRKDTICIYWWLEASYGLFAWKWNKPNLWFMAVLIR